MNMHFSKKSIMAFIYILIVCMYKSIYCILLIHIYNYICPLYLRVLYLWMQSTMDQTIFGEKNSRMLHKAKLELAVHWQLFPQYLHCTHRPHSIMLHRYYVFFFLFVCFTNWRFMENLCCQMVSTFNLQYEHVRYSAIAYLTVYRTVKT